MWESDAVDDGQPLVHYQFLEAHVGPAEILWGSIYANRLVCSVSNEWRH